VPNRSLWLLVILGAALSCGSAKPTAGSTLRGKASWYGGKHHGGPTASGERFDKNDLTAAHRTLPFGSRVRVTNLKNGQSVVVRINDRGPFGRRKRIIDVSEAAARKLGMIRSGVVPVSVDVLELGKGRKKKRRRRRRR
jgi:rare lipoprotein A